MPSSPSREVLASEPDSAISSGLERQGAGGLILKINIFDGKESAVWRYRQWSIRGAGAE